MMRDDGDGGDGDDVNNGDDGDGGDYGDSDGESHAVSPLSSVNRNDSIFSVQIT